MVHFNDVSDFLKSSKFFSASSKKSSPKKDLIPNKLMVDLGVSV